MNTYTKRWEWRELTARESKKGIILEFDIYIQGETTGRKLLLKGAKLPTNDEELDALWANRDRGRVLRKGFKVR